MTLINPAGPGIGDPVGMERMFTATCDQPATTGVYLNGNPRHTERTGRPGSAFRFERFIVIVGKAIRASMRLVKEPLCYPNNGYDHSLAVRVLKRIHVLKRPKP